MRKLITLEEGLSKLEGGIVKAKLILDGYPTSALFTSEEYMKFYDCVYFMCVQPHPYDYSEQLYERFKKALEDGIFSRVLPSLVDKNGASLLTELLRMWGNYKLMARCLGGFFLYLGHHCTNNKHANSLDDISVGYFHDRVCKEFYQKFLDAVISLINEDRDDKPIDRNLLKNVSTFFVEIGGKRNMYYYDNFEKVILADTASYYSQLASQWLHCYSSADYVLKAEWCLNEEKGRGGQFLFPTSLEKQLQVVHWQLLGQTASKLIEKRNAENHDLKSFQELLSRCANLSLGDGGSALPS